jgi:hypothetical protein
MASRDSTNEIRECSTSAGLFVSAFTNGKSFALSVQPSPCAVSISAAGDPELVRHIKGAVTVEAWVYERTPCLLA